MLCNVRIYLAAAGMFRVAGSALWEALIWALHIRSVEGLQCPEHLSTFNIQKRMPGLLQQMHT